MQLMSRHISRYPNWEVEIYQDEGRSLGERILLNPTYLPHTLSVHEQLQINYLKTNIKFSENVLVDLNCWLVSIQATNYIAYYNSLQKKLIKFLVRRPYLLNYIPAFLLTQNSLNHLVICLGKLLVTVLLLPFIIQ